MNQITLSAFIYDPTLSRMLNADPFIADATSAQDFNRYSYVRNNPLKYTDPSGYKPSRRRRNVPMYDDGTYPHRQRWSISISSSGKGIDLPDRYKNSNFINC